jgi:23S rRNA-/tRNA-specific pseudouridylate synthase
MYQSAFEIAFPIKLESKYVKHDPWMTSGLLVSSRHKNKLLSTKLQKPTPRNIQVYKEYKCIFSRLCKQSKKQYYATLLNDNMSDAKITWKILKNVMKYL